MGKITCDAEEANEAVRHRFERFQALADHIVGGIVQRIVAHNKHEAGLGFLPATPREISQSSAEAIATLIVKNDPAAMEWFIEDLRLSMLENFAERYDTL